MWVLTGLLIGFPLGFALHRSDFCMHSAFRESLTGKPGDSVRAYLLPSESRWWRSIVWLACDC